MEFALNESETRVLGCLVEKAFTTPENYPLSLNSLTSACNQKSNRTPVMSIQEPEVVRALDRLRSMHLVWETQLAGSRVPKYEHNIQEIWQIGLKQVAILAVLLLRGPQTLGELRARSSRMIVFEDLTDVEETLQSLEDHDEGPFAMELPRLPGHKENRFMHLLGGQPEIETIQTKLTPDSAVLQVRAENERIEELEDLIQTLQDQLNELRTQFEDFKGQFD